MHSSDPKRNDRVLSWKRKKRAEIKKSKLELWIRWELTWIKEFPPPSSTSVAAAFEMKHIRIKFEWWSKKIFIKFLWEWDWTFWHRLRCFSCQRKDTLSLKRISSWQQQFSVQLSHSRNFASKNIARKIGIISMSRRHFSSSRGFLTYNINRIS